MISFGGKKLDLLGKMVLSVGEIPLPVNTFFLCLNKQFTFQYLQVSPFVQKIKLCEMFAKILSSPLYRSGKLLKGSCPDLKCAGDTVATAAN